jgi:hypothetical protein
MVGYKLTESEAASLVGNEYAEDCYFNPVLDINGIYFIFEQEVNECINPLFWWVKDLQQAEYVAP